MKNPPISLLGKVTNPWLAADLQLAYYFKALKHSSSIVSSEVRSLTYDLNSSKSPTEIKTKISESLNYLYQSIFNEVTISVELVTTENNTMDITLDISIYENGEHINLSKLINASNSKINEVKNLINHGVR